MAFPSKSHPERTKEDLLHALPVVLGEMCRVPALKHWHDAKNSECFDQVNRRLVTIIDDACTDTSMLAVRNLDEFFRARYEGPPETLPDLKKARPGDLFAEEYGYKDDQPLLSKNRRADINQLMGHLTWRRVQEQLTTDTHSDLICVIGHCVKFLTWLIESKFVECEHELTKRVVRLRDDMRRVFDDSTWGKQLELNMSENVMKATAVVLSGSPFAETFKRWMAAANETLSPVDGSAGNPVIMKFPADLNDLATLIKTLDGICTNVGCDFAYENYPLGTICGCWAKLHSDVVDGKRQLKC